MVFTSHLKPGHPPALVREGFSLGAALFGWLWLLVQRAWIPALLALAASLIAGRLTAALASPAPAIGLFLLQGLFGRDLVRWGLARRGYVEGPPVVAGTRDGALVRLLTERPDLLSGMARARPGAAT
jgi:hypothetical protein